MAWSEQNSLADTRGNGYVADKLRMMVMMMMMMMMVAQGMDWVPWSNLLYSFKRLKRLDLESLELRRLRQDLIFTYKLVFGLVDLSTYMISLDVLLRKFVADTVINCFAHMPLIYPF